MRETTERVLYYAESLSTTKFFFNLFGTFSFSFATVRSSKIGGYKERTVACSLLNDFDGQFDLVGLFVGVEFDEGLQETGHTCGAGFGGVLRFDFLFGF